MFAKWRRDIRNSGQSAVFALSDAIVGGGANVGSGGIESSAVVDAFGSVCFGSNDGHFYCYDAVGQPVWSYPASGVTAIGAIKSTAATLQNGNFIFGCSDGKVYQVASDGTFMRSYLAPGGGAFTASPSIATDGTVFIGNSGDNYVYALSNRLSLLWRYQTGGPVESSAAQLPSSSFSTITIIVGSGDGKLYCFVTENNVLKPGPSLNQAANAGTSAQGGPLWVYSTPGPHPIISSPAVSSDGIRVYFGSDDNSLYCLDAATGALVWSTPMGDKVRSSPALSSDGLLVYVGSMDGSLYSFSTTAGSQVWSYVTGGDVQSSPVITSDNYIYIISTDGVLHCVSGGPSGGSKMWDVPVGSVSGLNSVATSSSGYVYAVASAPSPANTPASAGQVTVLITAPSGQPSGRPSRQPTGRPSNQPSRQPTSQPSRTPTGQPTRQPSTQPTARPSRQPSNQPTSQPTTQPTGRPSRQPTSQPSSQPTSQPTGQPSGQPSTQPTARPSRQPSNQPTSQPSRQPSTEPTSQPTSYIRKALVDDLSKEAQNAASLILALYRSRSAHTGPIVRFRRSTDDAEEDFYADTDGLTVNAQGTSIWAWRDASTPPSLKLYCTIWYDQSGFDNHARQTTKSRQPYYNFVTSLLGFAPDRYLLLPFRALAAGTTDYPYTIAFQHGVIKNSPAAIIGKLDGSLPELDVGYLRNGTRYARRTFNRTDTFGVYGPSYPIIETYNQSHQCAYIKGAQSKCLAVSSPASFNVFNNGTSPRFRRQLISASSRAYIGQVTQTSSSSSQTNYYLDGEMATVNVFKLAMSKQDIFTMALVPTPPPSSLPSIQPTVQPSSQTEEKKPINLAAILGGSVGGSLAFCCCFWLLLLLIRRRRKQTKCVIDDGMGLSVGEAEAEKEHSRGEKDFHVRVGKEMDEEAGNLVRLMPGHALKATKPQPQSVPRELRGATLAFARVGPDEQQEEEEGEWEGEAPLLLFKAKADEPSQSVNEDLMVLQGSSVNTGMGADREREDADETVAQGNIAAAAAQAEAEAEAVRLSEERARREAEVQLFKQEQEARLRAEAEAEANAKAEAEAEAQRQKEQRLQAEREAKATAEAQAKAEEEAQRLKQQEEDRIRAEAEAKAKAKAEAEAKAKAEAEAKADAEAEAEAQRLREEEERTDAEAEAQRLKHEKEEEERGKVPSAAAAIDEEEDDFTKYAEIDVVTGPVTVHKRAAGGGRGADAASKAASAKRKAERAAAALEMKRHKEEEQRLAVERLELEALRTKQAEVEKEREKQRQQLEHLQRQEAARRNAEQQEPKQTPPASLLKFKHSDAV